jgi:hypothetical protein
MAADVKIDIAAEFTGKKGFKQAETATDKLGKSVKKLAGGLLLAFGAKQVLAFGKASVKAFVEDDKAATALGQTLKNLNLAYGSNIGTVNGFISRLEMQTGVLDDELRPAMDRLLRATGDVTKSQELLGLALDIAAGTGKSVTQVSQSLQKAYLGQKQALGRLGVGLTKAELETSSFEEVQERLSVLFAGQASAAVDTYAGSLAKLTIAGNNAKETIGKGLVDALKTASNSTSTDELITKINNASEAMANFIREAGYFIAITKSIFDLENLSWTFQDPRAFKGMGNISMTVSSQDTQKADAAAKKAAAALAKITQNQSNNQAKILKDKKLAAAIDKAQLALGKGSDVFDMDKIQIAAALTNQAEQLGKATTASQVLQIANDTARLNVKRSILALEDAIAAKDEAAIIAATNKLNADLKVLGALGMQNVKLQDIKSILESLVPADLINQSNLDEALRKIKEMLTLLGGVNAAGTTPAGKPAPSYKPMGKAFIEKLTPDQAEDILSKEPVSVPTTKTPAQISGERYTAQALEAYNKALSQIGLATQTAQSSFLNGIDAGLSVSAALSGARYAAQAQNSMPQGYVININTGVGDPNAIAEAIDNVLREAQQRGTLTAG